MSVRCERNVSWSSVAMKGSDIPPGCELSRVESADICNARTPKGCKFTKAEDKWDCKKEERVLGCVMTAWICVPARPCCIFRNLGEEGMYGVCPKA